MNAARRHEVPDAPEPSVRPRPVKTSGAPLGVRTRLVHEVLEQVLTPRVRAKVLARAGWDEAADAPRDEPDPRRWVDTCLFPLLVEKTTLAGADGLRRELRDRLAPPASPARSGVRLRAAEARPTAVPPAGGACVLLWQEEAVDRDALLAALGPDAQLVVVSEPEELARTLQVLGERVAVVLMDRRDADEAALDDVDPEALRGRRVVLWGPPSLRALAYTRALAAAERAVGCDGEVSAEDVAQLCAMFA